MRTDFSAWVWMSMATSSSTFIFFMALLLEWDE
jgi:hypothetical protein